MVCAKHAIKIKKQSNMLYQAAVFCHQQSAPRHMTMHVICLPSKCSKVVQLWCWTTPRKRFSPDPVELSGTN